MTSQLLACCKIRGDAFSVVAMPLSLWRCLFRCGDASFVSLHECPLWLLLKWKTIPECYEAVIVANAPRWLLRALHRFYSKHALYFAGQPPMILSVGLTPESVPSTSTDHNIVGIEKKHSDAVVNFILRMTCQVSCYTTNRFHPNNLPLTPLTRGLLRNFIKHLMREASQLIWFDYFMKCDLWGEWKHCFPRALGF